MGITRPRPDGGVTKRRHFIVFACRNSNELWEPWPGVYPPSILNEEKALRTSLGVSKAVQPGSGFLMTRRKLKMADEVASSSESQYLGLFAQEHVDFRISVGRR